MAKDKKELVKRCAGIGLTEDQISFVLDIDIETLKRDYKTVISENLPADFMKLRMKRFYRAFPKRKVEADYQKRRLCPTFKIESSLRSLINYHIRKNGASKTFQSIYNLSYTVDELMEHLEKKFVDGMNWDNYGKVWHVDHIKPASWFSYKSTEDKEFQECWALSNLQPLFAKDNLSKGNKWEG